MLPPAFPVPECRLTYNPVERLYGFSYRFVGKPPHHQMQVFESLERLMAWVDMRKERVWEEPSDADEECLLISRRVTAEAFQNFYVRRW